MLFFAESADNARLLHTFLGLFLMLKGGGLFSNSIPLNVSQISVFAPHSSSFL
jgi:hypothetical protein